MPTFFSDHQTPLSLGRRWCSRLWCKPIAQVHFLPSMRLAPSSPSFNRGCFSCRKEKKHEDLEIQSRAVKKS